MLTFDKNALCQPGTINFSAPPNNNISSYDWDFGDGSVTSTTATTISHFYATYGTFLVTLTAKSLFGCDSSDTATITV
ncbi:MAG: PKD domain-containing protein, partial [Bacteroidetes bacterium]|nr:PKD domain-containing protein [Bacteroidota bacterium]